MIEGHASLCVHVANDINLLPALGVQLGGHRVARALDGVVEAVEPVLRAEHLAGAAAAKVPQLAELLPAQCSTAFGTLSTHFA